jgi:hypothetical protein
MKQPTKKQIFARRRNMLFGRVCGLRGLIISLQSDNYLTESEKEHLTMAKIVIDKVIANWLQQTKVLKGEDK